ncbi:hypothetical protein Pla108_39010 [Botrimarina colliarenosi]|uniref:Uncharacterized protein n=1 Tax=Botrimarina colliarenosi TaxID=2528001 RepID=A0A5C6A290_9BACT|nr:DUF6666 family protein [Botrimarina colliarenosi]TWT93407.1 hypothetical protein Pla108_39010 [Botrimarina colliarenosi]
MRRLMHALFGLLAASSTMPATAQLQWQSTGVQQVSHTAPAPRAASGKPAAKAPTVVRQASAVAPPAAANRPAPVRQAVAAMPPAPRSGSAPRVDASVQAACATCGCAGGCGCGGSYYEEPGCAVVDPSCAYGDPGCGCELGCGCGVEPGCGLTYGETCGCGDVGCGGTCGMGCGDGVCGDDCVPVVLCLPPIRELTLFAGVQAFKNPLDGPNRDRGNFGFTEGVNVGGSMSFLGVPGVGYQLGYRSTQNQLHGDDDLNTDSGHTQQFFTGGLFHRKPVGLQYGVVYDLLQDERQGSMDFGQLRGLISVTNPCGHEIGFQFASKMNENTVALGTAGTVTYHATNQYLFFYRKHGCQGGEVRFFGGFDDDSKGIVGFDASIPLTDRWSLATGFTYVIPEEDGAGIGAQEEAWNLGTSLVWHYGKRAKQSYSGQYRPLFDVADNGSLIIDDRP